MRIALHQEPDCAWRGVGVGRSQPDAGSVCSPYHEPCRLYTQGHRGWKPRRAPLQLAGAGDCDGCLGQLLACRQPVCVRVQGQGYGHLGRQRDEANGKPGRRHRLRWGERQGHPLAVYEEAPVPGQGREDPLRRRIACASRCRAGRGLALDEAQRSCMDGGRSRQGEGDRLSVQAITCETHDLFLAALPGRRGKPGPGHHPAGETQVGQLKLARRGRLDQEQQVKLGGNRLAILQQGGQAPVHKAAEGCHQRGAGAHLAILRLAALADLARALPEKAGLLAGQGNANSRAGSKAGNFQQLDLGRLERLAAGQADGKVGVGEVQVASGIVGDLHGRVFVHLGEVDAVETNRRGRRAKGGGRYLDAPESGAALVGRR